MRNRIKKMEKKKIRSQYIKVALAYNKKIRLKINLQKKSESNKIFKDNLYLINSKTVLKICQ